ncbi:oxygen-insensitive NADPH nitroreductase [Marinomonas piezotolerans]|uniref:Oxygen-insensitive NADPH nitroreductase n=1 Tax=Marinomonas piezotolerans TaxID=2213058 RepID=A0A370U985_9GAMM|nr:oxygen-insensitive NADPH nitroreductase [Marinomonas piezotolerans]RDL44303.1 oxygen-insensitive NADPH nitroreductase [Marinomonas piezotolerans]
MNPTIELLTSHRSIRKFTSESLPPNLLETLVKAGQGASTSNHVQACSVIRVSDAANRETIMALAGNQPYISTAPEFLVFCADMKRNVDAAERTGIEATRGMTEQLLVSTVDVALFAQNVAVAAESVGLGIVYIGGIRNNPAPISELLKLPEHVYPVFGMCIGYPDQQPEVKPRLPLTTVLKQDYYNSEDDEAIINRYDQDMSDYYLHRSGAAKDSNWSKGMAPMFSGKLRPHMREFLISKGFEMK